LHKLLMVDDEELIRTGFREKIDWSSLGFEFLEPCANGHLALQSVEKHRPDVVMTDICMPQMDGLDLCRILARDHPEVRVVVLSGHDDFEYVRESLRNRVMDYLLKPVTREELKSFLEKLSRDLEQPRMLTESEALHLLLEGALTSDQRLTWEGGAAAPGECWCAGRLTLFPPDEELATPQGLLVQIDRVLSERLRPWPGLAAAVIKNGGRVVNVDLAFSGTDPGHTNLKAAREATRLLEEFRQVRFQGCGALGSSGSPAHLPASLVEAADATLLRFFRAGLLKTGVPPWCPPIEAHRPLEVLAGQIESQLREGDRSALAALVVAFQRLLGTSPGSITETRRDLVCLLGTDGETILDSCLGSSELVSALEGRIRRQLSAAADKGSSVADRALAKLREEVGQRLAEPELSIDGVSQHLQVSPSYLAKLLRRKWDTNFSRFLREARISKAKELLAATNFTTTRIAEQIGFNDYRYFSNQFKRLAGLTPSEYRIRNRNAL